ncbi:MAG: hypothetical protein V4628_11515 [Pseudomonadota bacterium]
MQLDLKALGTEIGQLIAELTLPLQKTIDELTARLAAVESRQPEQGLPGKDGADGINGKSITVDEVLPMIVEQVKSAVDAIPKPKDGKDGIDAPPVEIDASDIVKELLSGDEVKNLVVLEVSAYLQDNPPAPGKDGVNGINGQKGDAGINGEKGEDGKDGAGIADLLIDRDGALTASFTDGRMKSLGVIVGKDGSPGKEGADFTELEIDYDGERTITIKSKNGVITKRLPIPMDKGYWSERMACEKADIVTHNGVAFIAKRDTSTEPKTENSEDWRILARKGVDGKHGRNGIDKTTSVKTDG